VSIWLIIAALPLWQAGHLTELPATGMVMAIALVPLPVVVMSWKYFFRKYILVFKKN
jgi:hypothetical protein